MGDKSKAGETEEKKRNKKTARTDTQGNNPLMWATKTECKCGSKDYRQISSWRCRWKGLSKEEVARNYE